MFDTALLESGPSRRVRGKGSSLPLAVAAHLVVIGVFAGASAWKVGDPVDPVMRIAVFPDLARLSPPPPGGGSPGPPPRPLRSNVQTQPTSLPDLPDAPEQNELAAGTGEPSTDSTGSGSEPAIDGGSGDGRGSGLGESRESEPILDPGGDVTFPVLLTRVEPPYPEAARRARLEGIVILQAVITAEGDVDDVRVLKTLNPLLDAAALQAVRQWRYRPATLNGRSVSVYLTVTVTFGLRS